MRQKILNEIKSAGLNPKVAASYCIELIVKTDLEKSALLFRNWVSYNHCWNAADITDKH